MSSKHWRGVIVGAIGAYCGCLGGISVKSAAAGCRTVSEAPPADFDPLVGGCFKGSSAARVLYWKNQCVGYSLQQDASSTISLEDFQRAADASFDAWNSASCGGDGAPPSLRAIRTEPVVCDEVRYNKTRPNQNVIVFRDTEWPHSDAFATIGLTTVQFDPDTGEILGADMELNSAKHRLTVSRESDAGAGAAYDLQTVITHEAGHFLGLAHSLEASSIMYAFYKPGSVNLTMDDISTICDVYPPGGDRPTTTGTLAAGPCDTTPRHGFSIVCEGPEEVQATKASGGCTVAPRNGHGSTTGPGAIGAMAGLFGGWLVRRRSSRSQGAALKARSVHRRGRWAAWALALALGVGAGAFVAEKAAEANVAVAVFLEELVKNASFVAVVDPVESVSVWENGRIYTYTRLQVAQSVAGQAAEQVWVRTMGGIVGNVGQRVEGEAVFTPGHPTLVFLERLRVGPQHTLTSNYVVTARAQGQYVIRPPAEGGTQRVLVARRAGLLLPRVAASVPVEDGGVSAVQATSPQLAAELLSDRSVEEAAGLIAQMWSSAHPATE